MVKNKHTKKYEGKTCRFAKSIKCRVAGAEK